MLRLLPSDLSATGIAGALFLSPNTVRSHMKSIYRKLARELARGRRGASGGARAARGFRFTWVSGAAVAPPPAAIGATFACVASRAYTIVVADELSDEAAIAFEGMALTREGGNTVLSGRCATRRSSWRC